MLLVLLTVQLGGLGLLRLVADAGLGSVGGLLRQEGSVRGLRDHWVAHGVQGGGHPQAVHLVSGVARHVARVVHQALAGTGTG